MTARYVKHDGYTWRIIDEGMLDDEHGYTLHRRIPGRKNPIIIVARASECDPVTPDRRRRFRDDDGVIEFNARGEVVLREKGRRKRYTTSIKGLLTMCARAEAARLQAERAHRRRIGRRK